MLFRSAIAAAAIAHPNVAAATDFGRLEDGSCFAGQEGIAPRPLNSALDLSKIESTGFTPGDSMQRLDDYVRTLM